MLFRSENGNLNRKKDDVAAIDTEINALNTKLSALRGEFCTLCFMNLMVEDSKTWFEIYEVAIKKKTVILVSHRKSTMNIADTVFEMKNGRIS